MANITDNGPILHSAVSHCDSLEFELKRLISIGTYRAEAQQLLRETTRIKDSIEGIMKTYDASLTPSEPGGFARDWRELMKVKAGRDLWTGGPTKEDPSTILAAISNARRQSIFIQTGMEFVADQKITPSHIKADAKKQMTAAKSIMNACDDMAEFYQAQKSHDQAKTAFQMSSGAERDSYHAGYQMFIHYKEMGLGIRDVLYPGVVNDDKKWANIGWADAKAGLPSRFSRLASALTPSMESQARMDLENLTKANNAISKAFTNLEMVEQKMLPPGGVRSRAARVNRELAPLRAEVNSMIIAMVNYMETGDKNSGLKTAADPLEVAWGETLK